MEVKNGDKFMLVEDVPYCPKHEWFGTQSTQVDEIAVDGVWLIGLGRTSLRTLWDGAVEEGLVKEIDGEEYFYIPAGKVLEIDKIDINGFGVVKIGDRVQAVMAAFGFVTGEPDEDNEEIQIKMV